MAAASRSRPPVAIAPEPGGIPGLAQAVERGGGTLCDLPRARALIWSSPQAAGLSDRLAASPGVGWVQLPYAGIERFRDVLDRQRLWTCAKGVYGRAVAEHALALILAGLRRIARCAQERVWLAPAGRTLHGATVVVIGGGGIGRALVELLAPFRCDVTVVRRSGGALPHVRVVDPGQARDAVARADVVVLAVPLTAATDGLVDADFLRRMRDDAWLVNVGRGAVVRTDDLVTALEGGRLGGAALDVTDPEPLPEGHPLWSLDDCIVTPHAANPPELGDPVLLDLVADNVARFAANRTLRGSIDVDLAY